MTSTFALRTADGSLVRVNGERMVLGSDASSSVVVRGWRVSRRHAEVFLSNNTLFVRDLDSRTGTLVNQRRIEEAHPLSHADVIDIGGSRFTVSMEDLARDEVPDDGDAADSASAAGSEAISATTHNGDRHAGDERSTLQDDQLQTYLKYRKLCNDRLLETFDLRRVDTHRMSDADLRRLAEDNVATIVGALKDELPSFIDVRRLIKEVCDEAVGLGPLESMLADPRITEIMVNRAEEIFVEREGRLTRWPVSFTSDRAVMGIIERIVAPLGRRIDESSPLVDARLKDGSRVNAIIPPLALKGPSITIRKFSSKKLVAYDLVRFGSADEKMVEFMRVCVERRKNVLISGGTGSGKTTLLNILSNFIPDGERIVTIEDAAELQLRHQNLVSLEARPANIEGRGLVTIRDLVKNSLRMRPDRIVVGECRGGEALDMLQAMNTGHDGSLTTAHANSPRDMLARLEVMVLMAGMDLPVTAIREQVASAVDIIVQQTRFVCGTRKITNITEVTGVESGKIQLQDIFSFVQTGINAEGKTGGYFTGHGFIPEFYEELRGIGVPVRIDIFERNAAAATRKAVA